MPAQKRTSSWTPLFWKKHLFYCFLLCACWLCGSLNLRAEYTEELESFLPQETLALTAVGEWQSSLDAFYKTPLGKLWKHPQIAPLREKLQAQWGKRTELQTLLGSNPLLGTNSLSVKISSGFVALLDCPASTNSAFPDLNGFPVLGLKMDPAQVALLTNTLCKLADVPQMAPFMKKGSCDQTQMVGISLSKEQTDSILDALEVSALRQKWGESFVFTFWVSALNSHLLIELNSTEASRLILKAQGEQTPKLSQHAEWKKHRSRLLDSVFWGWAHLTPLVQKWVESESQEIAQISQDFSAQDPATPPTEDDSMGEAAAELMPAVVGKLGLESFLSASISVFDTPQGICTDYYILCPEASRQGVAQLVAIEAGDCTPPAFVSRDVLRFSRTRLRIATAWNALETLVNEIMPDVRDLLSEALLPVVQSGDPLFNFKEKFIAPLGNDVITCEYLGGNNEKQIIRFIQMPTGKQYIESIRKMIEILAPIPSQEKEVGRYKMTSVPLPDLELNPSDFKTNYCHLAFKDGFLALSTDRKRVEDFLNSTDSEKQLSKLPALNEAAQSIGGFSTGFFEYNDSRALAQSCYNQFKNFNPQEPGQPLLFPLFTLLSQDINVSVAFLKKFISNADLPEFESFADCFDFSVSIFQSTPEGFVLRTVLPSAEMLQGKRSPTETLPTPEVPEEQAPATAVAEPQPEKPQPAHPQPVEPEPAPQPVSPEPEPAPEPAPVPPLEPVLIPEPEPVLPLPAAPPPPQAQHPTFVS